MKNSFKLLQNNRSGFTFVELLVVIAILALLIAATANFLFDKGGQGARDADRISDLNQLAALITEFNSSYGEPPNGDVKSRIIQERFSSCSGVQGFVDLVACMEEAGFLEGEALDKLPFDPKQDIENDEGQVYTYLYGADNNHWKLGALLENQEHPDLRDDYSGSGSFGEEGNRTYVVISGSSNLDSISSMNP